MRPFHAALLLPLLAGTAAAEPLSRHHDETANQAVADQRQHSANQACRDRIETVRAERGLPRLQRENARPGEVEALMFYAVDRQIDGCDVLVMVNDPQDVRPLPPAGPGGWQLLPAQ